MTAVCLDLLICYDFCFELYRYIKDRKFVHDTDMVRT